MRAPAIHPANTLKNPREMASWHLGVEALPADVARFLVPLPCGRFVIVSPNAGRHLGEKGGTVIESGWHVIQTEVGCLYGVSHEQFIKKYRRI